MKLTELDWKNESLYLDNNNRVWNVRNGELIDNQSMGIYYTYTIKEMTELNLTKIF